MLTVSISLGVGGLPSPVYFILCIPDLENHQQALLEGHTCIESPWTKTRLTLQSQQIGPDNPPAESELNKIFLRRVQRGLPA